MGWKIKIHDPSGETRTLGISGDTSLGRSDDSAIPLRDATLPKSAVLLRTTAGGKYWLRVPPEMAAARIGDIPVREAEIPEGLTVHLGETRFSLEMKASDISLPEFPNGVRPWLTASEEGKETLWMAKKAAGTPLSIYLGGETGTGKEVLANLIHAWSERAKGPFVPLHCGALPLSLAESELFGHVKGSFTGATHHRPGALMQAHGGTLFLDEVGDLPLDIQVKLLRFLEDGEIRPVGADHCSHASVRIVCATHHPLRRLVEERKFRQDLYYRLASVHVEIPPLRSRLKDVTLLAYHFARELGRGISSSALLRLQAHQWPGNVRELRHAIERASGLAGDFTPVLGEDAFEFLMSLNEEAGSSRADMGAPILSLEEMERIMLLKSLKLSHGNRARAAKILGVARSTLFEMLKRHKIQGPRAKMEVA